MALAPTRLYEAATLKCLSLYPRREYARQHSPTGRVTFEVQGDHSGLQQGGMPVSHFRMGGSFVAPPPISVSSSSPAQQQLHSPAAAMQQPPAKPNMSPVQLMQQQLLALQLQARSQGQGQGQGATQGQGQQAAQGQGLSPRGISTTPLSPISPLRGGIGSLKTGERVAC